jgi:hypothetical protein
MFSTRKNSQKRVKIQKSTDNHSSFGGMIQENIDLSDFYSAVLKESFSYPYNFMSSLLISCLWNRGLIFFF